MEGLIHGGAYFWNLTLVWSSAQLGQHIVFQWLIPRRVITSLMAAVIHFRIFIDFRKGSCTQGHVCFTIGPGDSPSKMHIYGAASHGFTMTLVALTSGCYTLSKGNLCVLSETAYWLFTANLGYLVEKVVTLNYLENSRCTKWYKMQITKKLLLSCLVLSSCHFPICNLGTWWMGWPLHTLGGKQGKRGGSQVCKVEVWETRVLGTLASLPPPSRHGSLSYMQPYIC